MSQNIPDESQTPTEQPTGAALLGKMSDATEALLETQEKLVKAAADVAKHTTDPNAHGAATLANIVKAMPTPVLEDGMFSFKDADGNDIIAPVNLKGDKGDKGNPGDKGEPGDKGDIPDHQWNGTTLQLQKPDGSWGEAQDLRGPKGEDGIDGTDGAPGQAPAHEWNGTSLKFKNPDGTWGEEQNLQGAKGEDGSDGTAPEHEWNGTSLKFKNPDGTWGEEQNLQGPQGAPGDAAIATAEQPGIMQPDGATTTVDEDGLLSALGGNLLLNSELRITESGTFEAPVSGWYDVTIINGGYGSAIAQGYSIGSGGNSGAVRKLLLYMEKGQTVPVTIGAGGLGAPNYVSASSQTHGGATSFGEYTPQEAFGFPGQVERSGSGTTRDLIGAGYGGGTTGQDAFWYGGGGGAFVIVTSNQVTCGNGHQGVVILRYHDPAKAAGPQPEPALFSARRMARAVAEPATVNLYDPETGQGSVWREEDAEARLAEGLITEAAWTEICAARAAEAHAAWLADPATEAERFEMLRAARDAKLAATDYLVAPDYPLSEDQRAAVTAYRQALRDLPAQEGAPWDGGGEATPWPERPEVGNVQPQPEATEQTEEPEV